jgi:hypothetical protein
MQEPRRTGPRRPSVAVRVLSAMAVLTVAGTYVAAQIDFVRRHTLGFPPLDVRRYWLLQIKFIWVRGLGAALLLAALAVLLHRLARADRRDEARLGEPPVPPSEGRLSAE